MGNTKSGMTMVNSVTTVSIIRMGNVKANANSGIATMVNSTYTASIRMINYMANSKIGIIMVNSIFTKTVN